MILQGGTGNGYSAKVDSENKLHTRAVTQLEVAHTSIDEGLAFMWTATADWGADKNALWLRNDDTEKKLVIEKIIVSPAASCQFEMGVGTGNTVAGTAVVGVNMNRPSGRVALATCRHTNTNCDASAG